jgi:hypothetical protein
MGQGGSCLSESGVLNLLAGAFRSEARADLERHIDGCARCAQLIGEAANDSGRSGGGSVGLRPALIAPGMIIADRYHVRRLLGTGGMGEVHEVEDRLVGITVALKTLNARLAGDARALARLKREVAAARLVTHPNVCRMFDLGIDRDQPGLGALVFLTMEYLPGVTLARFLRAQRLSPGEALPLLIQLADGLGAAHEAGIVHRDLKTDNVMLVDQGDGGRRAVIMDFGLASFSVQDDATIEKGSGFSGTVAYAAPERMAGGRATAASDVYALGLIAREALTGRAPGLARAEPAPLPAEIAPRIAQRWEQVLARAAHLDAGARFANGGALAGALRALSRDDGRRPVSRRWPGAVGLAVAAIASLTLWGAARRPAPAPAAAALTPPHLPSHARAPAAASAGAVAAPPARPGSDADRAPSPTPARKRRAPVARAAADEPPAAANAAPPAPRGDDDLVRELRPRGAAGDDFALADPFRPSRP